MPIDLLPPDSETFNIKKKKEVSEKQKAHLSRARELALERIQKKKELEEKNNLSVKNEEDDEEEENEEEEVPIKKSNVKKAPVKKNPVRPKKQNDLDRFKYRTEEEIENAVQLEKFSKFMKQMSKYEEMKQKMKEEEEDKQKIHVKYTKEEFSELMALLDAKEKENHVNSKVEAENPVQEKKINKNVINSVDYNSHLARYTNNRQRNRFGK